MALAAALTPFTPYGFLSKALPIFNALQEENKNHVSTSMYYPASSKDIVISTFCCIFVLEMYETESSSLKHRLYF
jgi:hypothetical protein